MAHFRAAWIFLSFFVISDESGLTQQRIIVCSGFHPVGFSSASRGEVLRRFTFFFVQNSIHFAGPGTVGMP